MAEKSDKNKLIHTFNEDSAEKVSQVKINQAKQAIRQQQQLLKNSNNKA